jgi:hypothetical protein
MGGNAWAYLVDSVAGELAQGADVARYYAGEGTPPGRFLGRGLDGLGGWCLSQVPKVARFATWV